VRSTQGVHRKGLFAAFALLLFSAWAAEARPQPRWTLQQSGTRESLRGLSVVTERVVWASGSRGTVVRTTDGGMMWKVDTIPGATALDFRDIHAFGADTALVLSAGEDARIYLTTDGGRSWTLRYANRAPGVFFDGMAFWDSRNGIAFSDPVNGKFLLISTADGGHSWKEIAGASLPAPLPGEAGYAASGTGIATVGSSRVWFGTGGGARTRVIHSSDRGSTWSAVNVPMLTRTDGSGIYSLVFIDSLRGVAVGGTYTQPALARGNAAYTSDGGKTWTAVQTQPPRGYRSAVAVVPGTPAPTLIAAGTTGTDYSVDGGKSWAPLSDDGFNAVAFASAAAGWAVGDRGRIARFTGTVPIVRRDPVPAPHPR
jgi:photosystem II stability/assembly factor-like uncharacterized protein